METADYLTNTLLVRNVAAIAFRIYELPSDPSFKLPAAPLDIETKLRQDGHVVLYDPTRRALWLFQTLDNYANGEDMAGTVPDPTIDVGGCPLHLCQKGAIEVSALLPKPSLRSPQPPQTSTSSSNTPTPTPSQHIPSASGTQAVASQPLDQDAKTSDLDNIEPKKASASHIAIYDFFIHAILLSITSVFCSRTGALPLNSRTVLLSSEPRGLSPHALPSENPALMGTFGAYLTTGGALVINFSVSRCEGLMPLTHCMSSVPNLPGQFVFAAPLGIASQLSGPAFSESRTSSLTQPHSSMQALNLREDPRLHEPTWKQACMRLLHLRGVASSTLSDTTWIKLIVPRRNSEDTEKPQQASVNTVISWPASLCFRKRTFELSSTSRVGDTLSSGHGESHDPLSSARSWFKFASERDEKAAKSKADRAASAKESSTNSSDPRTSEKASVPSPRAPRRTSAAAVSAIYPTPPDAIQHLSGVTPSLDGTLSSPGNPLSSAAAPETDAAPHNMNNLSEPFDLGSDLVELKTQRCDSNLLGEADQAFCEMGGDMFDEHDITEADFNFFDEQPDDMDFDITVRDGTTAAVSAGEIPKDKGITHKMADESQILQQTSGRDSAGFTKPELRHARSTRNDSSERCRRGPQSGSAKREFSPFNPHTVFKRVRASLAVTKGGRDLTSVFPKRRRREFQSMKFDPNLPLINKKYEQGGQFDYGHIASANTPNPDPRKLLEPDFLRRHRHGQGHMLAQHTLPSGAGPLVPSLAGHEPTALHLSPAKLEASFLDDDDSSLGSDQDDSSRTSKESLSPLKSSVKVMVVEDDAASNPSSMKDLDPTEDADLPLATELPLLSKPETQQLPLSQIFADPEPLALEPSLDDERLIRVAQVLTGQAALGLLKLCNLQEEGPTEALCPSIRCQAPSVYARNAMEHLRDIVSSIVGGCEMINLKSFLDIQDVPPLGQTGRLQPRPIPGMRENSGESLRASNLYPIPSPHLEVRRSESRLSVLPTAVTFWESLGLAPASGGKNVKVLCVFPDWSGMLDNARTFLERLKSVYEMLKLGSWEKLPLPGDLEDGMVPYEVDRISTSPAATMTGHGSALVESMETVRGASSGDCESTIVVCFVYSPKSPGTIIEACTAFEAIAESHGKAMTGQRGGDASRGLVLQLVAADFLSSPTSVVVTPTAHLARLCMEMYDRCPLLGGPMSAPAIKLEQPPPRLVDFKLTMHPSASPMRENSCFHVAYGQTVDERWVSTAWTDDRGSQQTTASYCLGRKGRPLSRSLGEVIGEMWASTVDLISGLKVHWRVIVSKCGPLRQHEVDLWTELARAESKASVTVTLMTVDSQPRLQLIPPTVKLSPVPAPLFTTPVSTPAAAAGNPSPEQTGTPATPARETNAAAATTPGGEGAGGETEAEAVLVDMTDQTWGAVAGHRPRKWPVQAGEAPAVLATGYLVKKTGARTEEAPVLMEVKLVHADVSLRAYEALLREMLSHFRGLGTLARARGAVERERDVRPWHVAAAEKSLRALYLLL